MVNGTVGDKNPKANQKQADQKKAKADDVSQKKDAATAAKQVAGKNKKK